MILYHQLINADAVTTSSRWVLDAQVVIFVVCASQRIELHKTACRCAVPAPLSLIRISPPRLPLLLLRLHPPLPPRVPLPPPRLSGAVRCCEAANYRK